MSGRILLVRAAEEGAADLKKHLQRSLDVLADIAFDQAEAKARLSDGDYQLVIASAEVSEDEDTPVAPGEWLGAELLIWMRQQSMQTPGVVMASDLNPALVNTVLRAGNAQICASGVALYKEITQAAAEMLNRGSDTMRSLQPKYLKVSIVADTNRGSWTYDLAGEGFPYSRHGVIKVDDDIVTLLEKRSCRIIRDKSPEQLKELGQELMDRIFISNGKFYGAFREGLGRVSETEEKGLGNIKIRFHIARSFHPIFFEAIVSDDAKSDFWMLEAPICRTLHEYGCSREPLLVCGGRKRDEEFNCLIIESDVSGAVEGLRDEKGSVLKLDPLPHVEDECKGLEQILYRNKALYGIGRIVRIHKGFAGSKPFFDVVLRNLFESETKWHLVHYSGHSFYDSANETGYLFFPPASDGELPEKVDIQKFSAHLTDTRLLFLSGCQSSEMGFTIALAKCNIPAAIGFRREVIDDHAKRFADVFYSQLFNGDDPSHPSCLEHAFLRARRRMFDQNPNDWIWANPILLVQSE